MECSCGAIQKQLCNCKTWSSVYHPDPNDTNIVFMPKKYGTINHEKTTCANFFNYLFDVCLVYNIRYCGLRKRYRKNDVFKSAVSDLILLLCFLLTNSIVFFTLLTRIAIQIGYILLRFGICMQRTFYKLLTNKAVELEYN